MTTIFLKKYPSAKKPTTTHIHLPHHKNPSKEGRRNIESEIVLLEKRGDMYGGKKLPLKQFTGDPK